MGQRRETAVGVVVPQQQPIFGAAGEHAVGLVDAAGDEIIDQHADVRLIAVEDERLAAGKSEGRIGAGHESLSGGFLVAGGAVDLTGEVQTGDVLRFERRLQLVGRSEVVLDGVAVRA